MPHIHELYDFTASAMVIHPTQPKLLLLLHKKLGIWLQPGGHIELHENPLETLHHEIEEETGLRPSDYEILEPAEQPQTKNTNTTLPLPFHFNYHHIDKTHQHIDIMYLLQAKTNRLTDNPDGALAIGWFDIKEIQQKHEHGELHADTLLVCEWILQKKL